ncbi:3-dehydroquinate synthase [Legionella worsleiensis]|uniref:3-dehydroquinate synthase n=1 Tax=Legionella worsleiensis TaxID=45076 RepID=A0A0W1A905_9GAMM|nr:3-dehydroquinate synthase [Legionella worsleiensis]KTD77834.1 3-dehydroquinate synthase [Legionella worsleiensis]STY33076.1 3-dehydroquinate synthase [Legionella worsleiensis]
MAKFEVFTQVDVCLPGCHYPIIICRKGLHDSSLLCQLIPSQQVLIVTNDTVAPLYLESIEAALASKQCDTVVIQDGEAFKNQHSLFSIYNALIHNRHHRDTTVVALGGGVIGDLAGFAASTYQRGVGFVQIPTTLLAQIDASVGGKTAINHSSGKNLIGSFYQPNAVLIDLNSLDTLPDREFRAGLAEMIKYAVLEGGDFLDHLMAALQQGLTSKSHELPEFIAHCCRIKAHYVAMDEKETGQRALLNLGHTFAHALEAYTYYERWLHGEAVAIGLYCAAVLSHNLGLLDFKYVELIEQMLEYGGLPHKIPASIDLIRLMDLMRLDKKIKNNCLRFVVIKKPGECFLDDQVSTHCLHNTLITAVKGE